MELEDASIRDQIWGVVRSQAMEICSREPLLSTLVESAILQHSSLQDALIFRLANKMGGKIVTADFLLSVFQLCLQLDTAKQFERLAMEDLIAVEERDPACKSIAQVLLYFKGFKSLQSYRLAHILWINNRIDLAMVIQARATEVFGVDIHPAAVIGGGLMIDHGTGVVIGETAIIGKNCSFLHGITLGGTGTTTEHDRHPKIGNNVFIGCNATILGNIHIGDHSKIGATSLVLKSIPAGATAVGSPAVVKSINPHYAKSNTNDVAIVNPDVGIDVANDPSGITFQTTDSAVPLQGIKTWSHVWLPKAWSGLGESEATRSFYITDDYSI
jgi:serine O-acetyltransferase